MGTRGLFGFYYKGKYYIVYNHYDSYPECLGSEIVQQLKIAISNNQLDDWKLKVVKLKDVRETEPTPEQIKQLKPFTDLSVSNRSTSDWYCLLRKTQGSLQKILDAGYIQTDITEHPPVADLFIEYIYVIDLDNNKLDFTDHNDDIVSYGFDELPEW